VNRWFTEKHTGHSGISMEVREDIYSAKSPFQTIEIFDTYDFGRVFLLDGAVMLTERDEFIYHEMITHVPVNTHPDPEKVLIIGGGDGGTVRETLKHQGIKSITLVEIDRMVVEAAMNYLPGISDGLRNPRVRVLYEDGVNFTANTEAGSFDVIIVDSTDPVGPAKALFSAEFYKSCGRALAENGVFVSQSESPFYHKQFMVEIHEKVSAIFPDPGFYFAPVTAYPGGNWSFILGTRGEKPGTVNREPPDLQTRYYSADIHRASFALPKFLAEALE